MYPDKEFCVRRIMPNFLRHPVYKMRGWIASYSILVWLFFGFLGPGGVDSTPFKKQRYCGARTMKLDAHLSFAEGYPCSKFDFQSFVSLTTISSVLYRFVNRVLFHNKIIIGFLFDLGHSVECCSLQFDKKNEN